MNEVPAPDPEVMKNCIVNTGDLLIFQFNADFSKDDPAIDRTPRPVAPERIMQWPRELIDQIPDDILRERLPPHLLRIARPHLVPDDPPAAAAG